MKKQSGQSAVEFALVAPIIILMVLGMIYGGIMFVDYLNFNNQARRIAREISVATPEQRKELIDKYNRFEDVAAGVYSVGVGIGYEYKDEEPEDVVVNINFGRGDSKAMFFFMPKKFTITYKMKLENTSDSSDGTSSKNSSGTI